MKILLLLMLISMVALGQFLIEADLLTHYSEGAYFIVVPSGFILDFEQIEPYLSDTNFHGYLQNSNLNGDWGNNFHVSISLPKGYIYDCSIHDGATTKPLCKRDLSLNASLWQQFGYFVKQACSQPFWSMSFSNQFYDFQNYDFQDAFYNYIDSIESNIDYFYFQLNVVQQGDKMVENGLRTGTYTVEDFLQQAYEWEYIWFGMDYVAPGITDDAGYQWISNWEIFAYNVWFSYFSLQCVIFKDPADLTIENLMDDTYTRGYISNRKKTSDSTSLTEDEMMFQAFALSKVQLIEGDGIDGVTNTFAAAVWFIDFVVESLQSFFYFVDLANTGQYQRVLGEPPTFKPTPYYYALLFISLARDGNPQFLIPTLNYGLAGGVKVFGLQTYNPLKKILIINKDTNSSLNGDVRVKVAASQDEKIKCTYLQAPSLHSKVDEITIGGYQYKENDHNPQGSYKYKTFDYNSEHQAFDIRIKYAQVAVCEFRPANTHIPSRQCKDDSLLGVIWSWIA